MKRFLQGLFAIGEERISTLVVMFVITMCVVLPMYVVYKTVDGNMKDIILGFIFGISGVNGVNLVSKYFSGITTTPSTDSTTTTTDSTTEAKG